MQDTVSSKGSARVITIRVRGRLTSLFGGVLLVALLPFLAGSAPHQASVVLAAGSGHPVAPAVPQPDGQALGGGALTPGPPVGDAVNPHAAGTNAFLFPTLQLAPSATAEVWAVSAKGLPGFIWPVRGPESSGFGPRLHPVLGRAMFHTGIDLMVACGTPIRAAADGRVVYAAITPSWGRRVIIQHTAGLETGYAHMSRFLVTNGETVKQGQIIGLVGTTGWSTGCHLHFDVIVDGQYVDPAPYLGLPPSTTARIPYYASPHLVLDDSGTVVHTVEDGDVPIPSDTDNGPTPSRSPSPRAPEPTASSPAPTSSVPKTTSPTGTPTTSEPTTSEPTTSEPTTSSPTGTPSTSEPTTTSPTDTTTTTPPPTSGTTTTSPTDTTTTTPPPPSGTIKTSSTSSETTSTSATATTAATEPEQAEVADPESEQSTD